MLCPLTIGIFLSRIFKPFKNVRAAFWVCTVLLFLLFHVPFINEHGIWNLNGVFEALCIICIFPAIIWLAASGKTTDTASTRICHFLGEISFPLYIVHYPLMYVFYMWLIKTQRYTFAETWPAALATVFCSICLAWLCLNFYDKPVRNWLNRITRH